MPETGKFDSERTEFHDTPDGEGARILQRAIVFEPPAKIPDTLNWTGHIPFAFWLIDVLRPRVFVELGTHSGSSYLAFCQGVKSAGSATQCYAVDTWKGDEHAGAYDESVLQELRAYHDPLYADFSHLLQMTFDEALSEFADGSVDLLHIDGLHTYDAVRHDFETWLPKVSQRGVVLFHDITVRSRNFEVWRFWDEVSARYPSFAFPHSNGLGVLVIGQAGPELSWLTSTASKDPALTFRARAFFGSVGGNIVAERLTEACARLQATLDVRETRIAELDRAIPQMLDRAAKAEAGNAMRDQMIRERDLRILDFDAKVFELDSKVLQLDAKIFELNAHIDERNTAVKVLRARLDSIYASHSWKVTRPFRVIARLLHLIANPGSHKKHVMTARAGHHVEALGGGRFRAVGESPQLWLDSSEGRAPTGWALLRFEVKEAMEQFRPVMSALSGGTPQWLAAIPLPPITNGSAEILVQIPREAGLLRLDPSNRPGVFALGSLIIQEISPISMALRALIRHPIGFIKAARKLPRLGAFRDGLAKLFHTAPSGYTVWTGYFDTRTADDEAAIRRHISALTSKPKISVVMPVWNTPEAYLRKAIESVIAQLYPHWELCIADDASTEPHVARVLQQYAARDARIKLVSRGENGHIARASNSALALASGEFIALMDHDDILASHALYMIAVELNNHPDADIIYSDEDKIDEQGIRFQPFFKPDWDIERFYAQNYINHLTVYRASVVKDIGGFREGFDGSQDYDLALRVVAKTDAARIRHIPFVLYHWRIFPGAQTFSSTQGATARDSARRALQDYFDTKGETAVVVNSRVRAWNRVRRPVPHPAPRVSLIVPTRDRLGLLKSCVHGLLRKTDYPDIEVIIVDNESSEPTTLQYFSDIVSDSRVRVLRIEGTFNFSALNNAAARAATGAILGFINNDIEVIDGGWLSEMVSQLNPDDVGAVGAKLYYGDDTIQHGGVILGIGGVAGHAEKRAPRYDNGYFGQMQFARSVSVVTAACMLVKRDVFEALGGLDEVNLAVAFNDVDFCLRIRAAGYRIVWTPYAELYHLESASRGSDQIDPAKAARFQREAEYMLSRYGDRLKHDPYFNPNLSLKSEHVELAYPPRSIKPWVGTGFEEADSELMPAAPRSLTA